MIYLFCLALSVASADERITAAQALKLQKQGFAKLVDVREKTEVASGQAKGALWFPRSQIQATNPAWQQFLKQFSRADLLIFYCGNGMRAKAASEQAQQAHFKTHYFEWIFTNHCCTQ